MTRILFTVLALLAALSLSATSNAAPQSLYTGEVPLLFTYGSWQDKATSRDGRLVLKDIDGKGGGGVNVTLDLAARRDHSPAIRVRVNAANQAKAIRVLLTDSAGVGALYTYDLPAADAEPKLLVPLHGASLAELAEVTKAGKQFDASQVRQVQVQGDWRDAKFDVEMLAIELIEPTPAFIEARTARRAEVDAQRREALRARDAARAAIKHGPGGATLVHVGPVDCDILGIALQAGVVKNFAPVPYAAQPGDSIRESDGPVLVDLAGEIKMQPERRTLVRDGKEVGRIAGGRDGQLWLVPLALLEGEPLQTLTVDEVETYTIQSSDDPAYATPQQPVVVHRKSKPNDRAFPGDDQAVRHTIFLKLPHPLIDGRTYRLNFRYLNTRDASVTYKHEPRRVRSEAIHTQHAGYRPGDPFKRAYLSLWLGTGGEHAFAEAKAFSLIDESGAVAFTGKVEQLLRAGQGEAVRGGANLSQTNVYALDFSAFDRVGTYRVFVEGVGASHPVKIEANPWERVFLQSMRGFLAQRSGIALGPPLVAVTRPRTLHPGDGVRVFRSRTTVEQAYARDDGNWFAPLIDGRTDELVPHAWGGYQDAGDFDRAAVHLWATSLHLELLELFPDYFSQLKLALPDEEQRNGLPGLLNEALWNLECFRRLQDADGGVSGGIESSAHPRPGEDSARDSLVLMTYAPDAPSSYVFAAVGAKASRVLERYDAKRAATYREAALKAFRWAEARKDQATGKGYHARSIRDLRNAASAELLALTRDAEFDRVFQETTQLTDDGATLIEQQSAAFTYARLPDGVGDAALKQRAADRIFRQAEQAIRYAEGNAFGLTVEIADMPLIGPVGAFTVPGMVSQALPRADYLLTHGVKPSSSEPRTGELARPDAYRRGVLRAAHFSLGANPENMTMTTGVGFDFPRAPLHLDSRNGAQPVPEGLTVYGAYDTTSLPDFARASDWVHTWHIGKTMAPDSRSWPAAEGYVDFFLWPMMNEFTINQTMGPTSYWWGYLAASR